MASILTKSTYCSVTILLAAAPLVEIYPSLSPLPSPLAIHSWPFFTSEIAEYCPPAVHIHSEPRDMPFVGLQPVPQASGASFSYNLSGTPFPASDTFTGGFCYSGGLISGSALAHNSGSSLDVW